MKLAVILPTRRTTMCNNFLKNLKWQTRKPDRVVIVVNKCPNYPSFVSDVICEMGLNLTLIGADDSLNYAQVCNQGFQAASAHIETGIVAKWDDDDHFGPTYLARIEEGFVKAPDSAIVGIYDCNTRWLYGNFKNNPYMAKIEGEYPRRASSVCGPTISISAEKWRDWPNFRYDPVVPDIYADQSLFHSLIPYGGVINTISSEDFFYQRYPQETHDHGWRQPDPKE